MEGGQAVEVADFKNKNPELCSSKTGWKYAISNFAVITLSHKWDKIVCYGHGVFEFEPGLKSI
jgi:hypothetical protein